MGVGAELDGSERAILADLSRRVPLLDSDDQVVAHLLRQALSVRAYLQRSVVGADPMPASSKRHGRDRIAGTAGGSGAWRAKGSARMERPSALDVFEPTLQRHRRGQQRRRGLGVVLVAHERKVEDAGVDRGVHALYLPAPVY